MIFYQKKKIVKLFLFKFTRFLYIKFSYSLEKLEIYFVFGLFWRNEIFNKIFYEIFYLYLNTLVEMKNEN